MKRFLKGIDPVKAAAAICSSVLAVFCLAMFFPAGGEHGIYEKTLRLHILANSNGEEDQALKYELRDYILAGTADLFLGAASEKEAARIIEAALPAIEADAADFIGGLGYDYGVSASLSREAYPRRVYGGEGGGTLSFPAGSYLSLTLRIGGGEGENWWCVLFPPLCLSGAKADDALAAAGYSEGQINVLKREKGTRYAVRFRILEVLSGLFK